MMHTSFVDGDVAVLELEHGKVNAFDVEFLTAFAEALVALDGRALVLTGRGRAFCAGVDLVRLANEDASYIDAFFPALIRAFETLFHFPRPVVVAAQGHAIAGGAVLVSCGDHRIMAEGPSKFGYTELPIGVPFPQIAFTIARYATPAQHLQRMLYFGENVGANDALAMGLVDELVSGDELRDRAVARARSLAAIEPAAFAITKRQLRGPQPVGSAEVLARWKLPETRRTIRAFLDRTLS